MAHDYRVTIDISFEALGMVEAEKFADLLASTLYKFDPSITDTFAWKVESDD